MPTHLMHPILTCSAIALFAIGTISASGEPVAESQSSNPLPTFAAQPEFWQRIQKRLHDSGVAENFRKKARLAAKYEQPPNLADDLAGRFVLPGTGGKPFFVGSPPRWHENPTSPRDPEFLWSLNRMTHWSRLANGFALTGDTALAEKILAEMEHWIANCPLPPIEKGKFREVFYGETPWRSLEVGLRMERSWPIVIEAHADSPLLTAERLERIARSMHDHGKVLFQVCPTFWPKADHNHYLTENVGLMRLALLFPEFPESAKWIDHARREITRCAEAQLTPDGGQIEGCPHYHNICIRSFAEILITARRHGVEFPEPFVRRLRGALEYTLHTYRPSGTLVPFGDSDSTSVPPLVTSLLGALALNQWDTVEQIRAFAPADSFRKAAAEVICDAPDPDRWFTHIENLMVQKPLPLANWQRELGQTMMRNAWTRAAASVAVTCRTPVNNGHAHIDPASFDFTAYGRPLLVDPARYTYAETQDRRDFKSAKWHNSITINGREPFEYIDTWGFGPQRPGTITRVSSGPGWQAAECRQENFSPALHHRLVVLLDNPPALLVVDALDGLAAKDTVQLWFHLDSTRVTLDPTQVSANTADEGSANVMVRSASGLEPSTHPGRISDVIDSARDSTRVCFADRGGESRRVYPTLLLPRAAGSKDSPDFTISTDSSGAAIRIALGGKERTRVLVWTPGASAGPSLE